MSIDLSQTCAIQKKTLKCFGEGTIILDSKLKYLDNVSFVSNGNMNTCILEKNLFKCLGVNRYGQLGNGTKEPILKFQKIKELNGNKVTKFKISSKHSCAIERGALKCWGDNTYGQLGTNLWRYF